MQPGHSKTSPTHATDGRAHSSRVILTGASSGAPVKDLAPPHVKPKTVGAAGLPASKALPW